MCPALSSNGWGGHCLSQLMEPHSCSQCPPHSSNIPYTPRVTEHPLTENRMAQTSSDTQWGGNCHGKRAEGAGGSLWPPFHQENAAPVPAAGSLPVRGSLWAGWLSPCLPSQIQAGCALCGQSFPELWVCVERGCVLGLPQAVAGMQGEGCRAVWVPCAQRRVRGVSAGSRICSGC